MVSRKGTTRLTNAVTPAPPPSLAQVTPSRLPSTLRFPLLVVLSLSLSALLYSLAADVTGYELAAVSRSLNEGWQAAALVGWKVLELAVGWFFDYDDIDLISLTILSHAPYFYLLASSYLISAQTVLLCLAIDVVVTALPFRLLRPRAPTHQRSAPRSLVPNRAIIHDLPVRATTSLLAAAVYTTTLYLALRSWLPVHLAIHFDGLRSLASAHETELPWLLATFLPLGWAAREFIFTPAAGAASAESNQADAGKRDVPRSRKSKPFDPVRASLVETARHNLVFWADWDPRRKTLVQRTAVLTLLQGLNTWVQTYGTLEGADGAGAAGWAGVWATAGLVTGTMFGWVWGDA